MSVTPEVRVVTNCLIVPPTLAIFLIGAGLAMLVGGLTGVLTQVRVQDVGVGLQGDPGTHVDTFFSASSFFTECMTVRLEMVDSDVITSCSYSEHLVTLVFTSLANIWQGGVRSGVVRLYALLLVQTVLLLQSSGLAVLNELLEVLQ